MKADKKDQGKKAAGAETTDLMAENEKHTSKRNPEGTKKNSTKFQEPAASSTDMLCEPTTGEAAPPKRVRRKSKPADADSKEANPPTEPASVEHSKHDSKKAKKAKKGKKGKRAKQENTASAWGSKQKKKRKSKAKKSASKKDKELGDKADPENTPNGTEHTPQDQDLGELGAEDLGYFQRGQGYWVGSILFTQTLILFLV